jgi:hypothetical protein
MEWMQALVALLGPTAAVCFIGWQIEIRRHDKTIRNHGARDLARELRNEELDEDRIAAIRERTAADLEAARSFAIFSERLAGIGELIKELIRFVQGFPRPRHD